VAAELRLTEAALSAQENGAPPVVCNPLPLPWPAQVSLWETSGLGLDPSLGDLQLTEWWAAGKPVQTHDSVLSDGAVFRSLDEL
jgi:hypothetical protein